MPNHSAVRQQKMKAVKPERHYKSDREEVGGKSGD